MAWSSRMLAAQEEGAVWWDLLPPGPGLGTPASAPLKFRLASLDFAMTRPILAPPCLGNETVARGFRRQRSLLLAQERCDESGQFNSKRGLFLCGFGLGHELRGGLWLNVRPRERVGPHGEHKTLSAVTSGGSPGPRAAFRLVIVRTSWSFLDRLQHNFGVCRLRHSFRFRIVPVRHLRQVPSQLF